MLTMPPPPIDYEELSDRAREFLRERRKLEERIRRTLTEPEGTDDDDN